MKCWVPLALLAFAHGAAHPKPSQAQLEYQEREIVALTHFNMDTFTREQACTNDNWNVSSQPKYFWPAKLNVSNWVESYLALGAKSAILTAKHSCGFFLWPTKVTLPDGSNYGYHVFGKDGLHVDILKEFREAVMAAGLKYGFYYSLQNNFYLNLQNGAVPPTVIKGQVNLTMDQIDDVTLQALGELWSSYGDFSEIWFDGGLPDRLSGRVRKLLHRFQPHAALFGAGINNSANDLDWVGTESGEANYPIWSTGCVQAEGGGGTGLPPSQATDFCPKVSDVTLQAPDQWFYDPSSPLKNLSELIDIYHRTVGSNSVMEMDFAIDFTGNVAPAQAKSYREFGDWIRTCYGRSNRVAHTDFQRGNRIELRFKRPSTIDRVMLQENLRHGQLVESYLIEVKTEDSNGEWLLFSNGTAVGHKRIALVEEPFHLVRAVRVSTTSVAMPELRLSAFGLCPRGSAQNEVSIIRLVV